MKKMLSMGLIIATSFLVGCGVKSSVDAVNNMGFSNVDKDGFIYIFRDNETGVHYIKYGTNYGIGLCPRYNADGSIYVD